MSFSIVFGTVVNCLWIGLWWASRRNKKHTQELLKEVEHYSAHATHMYDQAAAQRQTTSELLNRILSYREGDNNHE